MGGYTGSDGAAPIEKWANRAVDLAGDEQQDGTGLADRDPLGDERADQALVDGRVAGHGERDGTLAEPDLLRSGDRTDRTHLDRDSLAAGQADGADAHGDVLGRCLADAAATEVDGVGAGRADAALGDRHGRRLDVFGTALRDLDAVGSDVGRAGRGRGGGGGRGGGDRGGGGRRGGGRDRLRLGLAATAWRETGRRDAGARHLRWLLGGLGRRCIRIGGRVGGHWCPSMAWRRGGASAAWHEGSATSRPLPAWAILPAASVFVSATWAGRSRGQWFRVGSGRGDSSSEG